MDNKHEILQLLRQVADGNTTPEQALTALKRQPFEDLGYAKVDFHRSVRQGAAEVIYGAGKTAEQIIGIARTMGERGCKNILIFHNHTDEGLRYAYPLIQYKRIRQCAAIVCMNQGAEAIGSFFANYQNHLMIGNRPVTFEIDFLHPAEITIGLTDTMQVYQLNRWLPLNTKNYHIYQSLEGLVERIAFLEKILTANILACTKGLLWFPN